MHPNAQTKFPANTLYKHARDEAERLSETVQGRWWPVILHTYAAVQRFIQTYMSKSKNSFSPVLCVLGPCDLPIVDSHLSSSNLTASTDSLSDVVRLRSSCSLRISNNADGDFFSIFQSSVF
jgi:hypothetical protein